jgi:glutamyl-tRNA reductase
VQNERFKYNLEKAETIIEEEKAEFYSWFQGLDYMPLIRDMKEKTGQDVSLRMTPVLKRLPLQAEEKEILKDQIYGASERMMNHLLFSLKSDMSDEAFREMLDAMQKVMQNYKLKK